MTNAHVQKICTPTIVPTLHQDSYRRMSTKPAVESQDEQMNKENNKEKVR